MQLRHGIWAGLLLYLGQAVITAEYGQLNHSLATGLWDRTKAAIPVLQSENNRIAKGLDQWSEQRFGPSYPFEGDARINNCSTAPTASAQAFNSEQFNAAYQAGIKGKSKQQVAELLGAPVCWDSAGRETRIPGYADTYLKVQYDNQGKAVSYQFSK